MLGDKRLGFEELFPLFTDTLESDNGFHRKPFEDVNDDLKRKEGCVEFTSHIVAIQKKEGFVSRINFHKYNQTLQ